MVGAPVSKTIGCVFWGENLLSGRIGKDPTGGFRPIFSRKISPGQYMERTSELGVLRWFARNCESTQDLSEGVETCVFGSTSSRATNSINSQFSPLNQTDFFLGVDKLAVSHT